MASERLTNEAQALRELWEKRSQKLTECYLNSRGGPIWLSITDPRYQPGLPGGTFTQK